MNRSRAIGLAAFSTLGGGSPNPRYTKPGLAAKRRKARQTAKRSRTINRRGR